MKSFLRLIHVFNKFRNTFSVLEILFLTCALVRQRNMKTRIQERKFTETIRKSVEIVSQSFVFEDIAIWFESSFRSSFCSRFTLLNWRKNFTALVTLSPEVTLTLNFNAHTS